MNETNEARTLRLLFEQMTTRLIGHPEALTVQIAQTGRCISLAPTVHKDDAGKVIGGGAATFHSLRNILTLAAIRMGLQFHMERLREQPGTEKSPFTTTSLARADWPKTDVVKLFNDVCIHLLDAHAMTIVDIDGEESEIRLGLPHDEQIKMTDGQLQDALSTVFMAIGRSCGRKLKVVINRTNERNERRTTRLRQEPS